MQNSFAQLPQLARVMTKSRARRTTDAVGVGGGVGGGAGLLRNVINPTRLVCKVVDSPFVFIHADDDMGEIV